MNKDEHEFVISTIYVCTCTYSMYVYIYMYNIWSIQPPWIAIFDILYIQYSMSNSALCMYLNNNQNYYTKINRETTWYISYFLGNMMDYFLHSAVGWLVPFRRRTIAKYWHVWVMIARADNRWWTYIFGHHSVAPKAFEMRTWMNIICKSGKHNMIWNYVLGPNTSQ